VNKPTKDITRKDIENYLLSIEDHSDSSKTRIKVSIKHFFKWFKGYSDKEEYPEIVKWIKTTFKKKNHKLPQILTPEEILKIAKATDKLRDQALILTLSG